MKACHRLELSCPVQWILGGTPTNSIARFVRGTSPSLDEGQKRSSGIIILNVTYGKTRGGGMSNWLQKILSVGQYIIELGTKIEKSLPLTSWN